MKMCVCVYCIVLHWVTWCEMRDMWCDVMRWDVRCQIRHVRSARPQSVWCMMWYGMRWRYVKWRLVWCYIWCNAVCDAWWVMAWCDMMLSLSHVLHASPFLPASVPRNRFLLLFLYLSTSVLLDPILLQHSANTTLKILLLYQLFIQWHSPFWFISSSATGCFFRLEGFFANAFCIFQELLWDVITCHWQTEDWKTSKTKQTERVTVIKRGPVTMTSVPSCKFSTFHFNIQVLVIYIAAFWNVLSSVETAALFAIAYLNPTVGDTWTCWTWIWNCKQCKLLRAEAKAQKFTVEPKHSSLPIASEAVNALLKQNWSITWNGLPRRWVRKSWTMLHRTGLYDILRTLSILFEILFQNRRILAWCTKGPDKTLQASKTIPAHLKQVLLALTAVSATRF